MKIENFLSLFKMFNEFYILVGKVIVDKVRLIVWEFGFFLSGYGLLYNYVNDVYENDYWEFFMFFVVIEFLVENIVNGLFLNKVFGVDKIIFRVFKDSFFVIFLIIMYLFNKLFVIGIFVWLWKMVEVIFVFKFGDFNELVNMCFIFLFLILLKVCERFVYC